MVEGMGKGTRIDGRPITESSDTVEAPDRQITRCAAAMRPAMSLKNGDTFAGTAELFVAARPFGVPGRARRDAGGFKTPSGRPGFHSRPRRRTARPAADDEAKRPPGCEGL